jgi:hypothetical protein
MASLMFIMLIFIFLFVSAGIDYTGALYTNNFSNAKRQTLLRIAQTPEAAYEAAPLNDDKPYLLVSASANEAHDTLAWMLDALKLDYVSMQAVPPEARLGNYRGVILAGDALSALGDLDALLAYVDGGGHVLFSQLPLPRNPAETAFLKTVGVLEMGDYVEYEQCEFYQGMLLGGMVRYDELPLRARQIRLSNLCKLWGVMWTGDPDAREAEVPLLFERRYGEGVFCLSNGPLLAERHGIGFLQSLLAIDETALVTPVVNAATLSLVNFPLLEGDPQKLLDAYARDALSTVRDILWIDLAYTITRNDIPATAFIPAANIPYGIAYEEFFSFLVRSMSESGSELGAMAGLNYTPQLRATLPDYTFATIYGQSEGEDFATAVSPLDDLTTDFATYAGGAVHYPVLTAGYSTTDQMNLITRGYAGGLMMIHHALDMAEPVLLNTPNFSWKEMNDDFTVFLYAALAPYPYIERLSASNGSNNLLAYQLVQPSLRYAEDGLSIASGIDAPSQFLLRTRRMPEAEAGLTLTKLEDNFYLIKMSGREGSIRWIDEGTP